MAPPEPTPAANSEGAPGRTPTPAPAPQVTRAHLVKLESAANTVAAWEHRGALHLSANGSLRTLGPEATEALATLTATTTRALPDRIRDEIVERSGLPWHNFLGQVLGWWLPQRDKLGFLRALLERARVHGVRPNLRWNAGRVVTATQPRSTTWALWVGGLLGLAATFVVWRAWPTYLLEALLLVGVGVVAGSVWQRLGYGRRCGDTLCRASLRRRAECPVCGALTTPPSATPPPATSSPQSSPPSEPPAADQAPPAA